MNRRGTEVTKQRALQLRSPYATHGHTIDALIYPIVHVTIEKVRFSTPIYSRPKIFDSYFEIKTLVVIHIIIDIQLN